MNKTFIDLYCVPMDLGSTFRGVNMGPSALRIAGIVEKLQAMGYTVKEHDDLNIKSHVHLKPEKESARFAKSIRKICAALHVKAQESLAENHIPLFLGGDHSISIGTVSGVASFFHHHQQHLGLIWLDAHGDMNTPGTSPSGNVHGMSLSAILNIGSEEFSDLASQGIKPENVVLVGVRDMDRGEQDIVRKSGIHVLTMKEIDLYGMAEITRRAIDLACKGTAGFHLSFDIDVLAPDIAPGVSTPVIGGISYREAHLFMELVSDSRKMISMDLVELNPVNDDRNLTSETAVRLVQSAFGLSIV
jgi:arginase